MQPMGHFQLLHKLINLQMDPQLAVDSPRWTLSNLGQTQSFHDLLNSEILLEDGYANYHDTNQADTLLKANSYQRHYQSYHFAVELQKYGHRLLNVQAAQNAQISHAEGDLNQIGFVIGSQRSIFGRAQVILRDPVNNILIAGSDPRSDGCAMPML